MTANIYLGDCMDAKGPYDLCLADPPYGIGMDNSNKRTKPSRPNSYTNYKPKRYHEAEWDKKAPDKECFDHLFSICKEQIFWGANYFPAYMPMGKGWIFWNKLNGLNNCFSDGEFAFSSKGVQSRYFECSAFHDLSGGKDRIHPTAKPTILYKWILTNYAKQGDRVLDPFGGSMSSVIAAIDMGFDIDCYEKDEDYYFAAKKRILNHIQQLPLFGAPPIINFHE